MRMQIFCPQRSMIGAWRKLEIARFSGLIAACSEIAWARVASLWSENPFPAAPLCRVFKACLRCKGWTGHRLVTNAFDNAEHRNRVAHCEQ